jgi:hypothetical protein
MNRRAAAAAFFIVTCCLIVVLHCTHGIAPLSGGGIDIGNPAKARVVDSLGNPVVNASVRVIAADDWLKDIIGGRSVVRDSAISDNSGYIVFDSLTRGAFSLQVDHPSGGALVRNFRITDSLAVADIFIRKYGTISGTLRSGSGAPTYIRIAGSTYGAPVSENGAYTFSRIAPGSYVSIVTAANSRWTPGGALEVASGTTIADTHTVTFNALLIDDFEDSSSTMKVGRFISGSRVYAGQADNSGTSARFQIVPEGSGGAGSLKGTLIRNGAYALIGFFLGVKPPADSLWDFRAASGLSFYAKGTGKLNVSFESDTLDKRGFVKQHSMNITLPPQWRRVTIPFDSLTIYNDNNPDPDIPWEESARSIKRIEFNALEGDTIEFWLDDLTVEGLDFSKVY